MVALCARKVRACGRKRRRACAASISASGLTFSGLPLVNVPVLINESCALAYPPNVDYSVSLCLPNVALFTEAMLINPIDSAPSPFNHSITLFRANTSREVWGGLSPTSNDTDGDGLYDGPNVTWQYTLDKKDHVGEQGVGTNPLNPDTDGDSANDGQEIFGYNLVWMNINADGNVTQNYVNGTTSNPLDAHNYGFDARTGKWGWRDLDMDGISDWNETRYSEVPAYGYVAGWARAKGAEQGSTFNSTEFLEKQFNPFVAENTPPMIMDMRVTPEKKWGATEVAGQTITQQ